MLGGSGGSRTSPYSQHGYYTPNTRPRKRAPKHAPKKAFLALRPPVKSYCCRPQLTASGTSHKDEYEVIEKRGPRAPAL